MEDSSASSGLDAGDSVAGDSEDMGDAFAHLPKKLAAWLRKLQWRAHRKVCQSFALASGGAATQSSQASDCISLDEPYYAGTQTVINQLLHIRMQYNIMDTNLRSQAATTKIPLILFHESSQSNWKKYFNLRLLYSTHGVAVLLCRKVLGRSSVPDLSQHGYFPASGRSCCNVDLLRLMSSYHHIPNMKMLQNAVHSAMRMGNPVTLIDSFARERENFTIKELAITTMELNLILPSEDVCSLLMALWTSVHVVPRLRLRVEQAIRFNSDVVFHDGTFKFMRFVQGQADKPSGAAAAAPGVSSTDAAPRKAAGRCRTPGGQVMQLKKSGRGADLQLTLSTDGRLLGFGAYRGETKYSYFCQHSELLRQRLLSIFQRCGSPNALSTAALRNLIARVSPFGVIMDGFPDGGIRLSEFVFADGIWNSFATERSSDGVAPHGMLPQAPTAPAAPPVVLRDGSFLANVMAGASLPACLSSLGNQETGDLPLDLKFGSIIGLDWRHPIWAFRKKLNMRHPSSYRVALLLEGMVRFWAVPPWLGDYDAVGPAALVPRVGDFDGVQPLEFVDLRTWGSRSVYRLWALSPLAFKLAAARHIPAQLLRRLAHQLERRFEGASLPQLSYAMVVFPDDNAIFKDQVDALEKFALSISDRYPAARNVPRSDHGSKAVPSKESLFLDSSWADSLRRAAPGLQAARQVHSFIQATFSYERGMRTGSITLETTASGISQHRPRKQTCKALATAQRQLLGYFDRQFCSDTSPVLCRRVRDRIAASRAMDDRATYEAAEVCALLATWCGQQSIIGLSDTAVPPHVYFPLVARFAKHAARLSAATGARGEAVLSRRGKLAGQPSGNAPFEPNATWLSFTSPEEMDLIAESATTSKVSREDLIKDNIDVFAGDAQAGVRVRFPTGMWSHAVDAAGEKTLCGQNLHASRSFTVQLSEALPTCDRCLLSERPLYTSRRTADVLMQLFNSTKRKRVSE